MQQGSPAPLWLVAEHFYEGPKRAGPGRDLGHPRVRVSGPAATFSCDVQLWRLPPPCTPAQLPPI